jgi:hypothetical protein
MRGNQSKKRKSLTIVYYSCTLKTEEIFAYTRSQEK